jgi:thiosulfate/3-mercaptopyruvate sulfurtransferase
MNPLVTTSWLADRLNDPGVIILDATLPPVGVTPPVDTHARYLARHIPGAIFFDIEDFSDRSSPYPHMLPAPDAFARNLSELGVSEDNEIIVYEQEGVFSAPRAWWMLRTLGAAKAHLLDGGLRAWVEAGLPTESGPFQRPPATFHATFQQNAVKDFAQMQQLIADHAQILDVRSSARFHGAVPEPRPGIHSGHMPGATNVPFMELAEAGRMKSAQELQQIFADKGVDMKQPITTTCGSGVTAAVVLLGLELAGAEQVSLYDGSWAEYAAQPEAVIEEANA